MRATPLLSLLCLTCFGACSLSPDVPQLPPPLADVEEPLDLLAEPDDEPARLQFPTGSFSGLYLEDARDTLASKLDQPGQLRIAQVVENSPAAAAGLQVDDLLLEVAIGDDTPQPLQRPSEWRQIELAQPAGTRLRVVVDRAGREATATLQLAARTRRPARHASERFREEQRIGIVVRTATEVEARAANLAPGAGAVLVGMSRSSPWRSVGLRFGDLLVAIDGRPLAHPQDLLQAVRNPALEQLRVEFVRGAHRQTVVAPLTERDQDLQEIYVPLLFSYEATRGTTEWSCLLSVFHYRSTAAAWRCTLFWLIGFGGGDAERLLEVDR